MANLNTDDGEYEVGDTLAVGGLTNLDLYLLPQGSTNINQAIWSSISTVSNVEHIFHEIPTTGNYEFWVYQQGALVIPTDVPFEETFSYRQPYGLAWWTATGLNVPGDFDNSGTIDAADLAQWQGDYSTNDDSDADGDGDSDGNDFVLWQRNLGATSVLPANTPVPEPHALLLALCALPLHRRWAA